MLIAFLRHIHEHLPVPTRMLSWNKAKPGRKMPSIFKFGPFTNGGNNGCRSFRADPFNFGNSLAGF